MKLKNSWILLIAMALFLLISVGSVCASENTTADDAVLASDDGAVDVLGDEIGDEGDASEDTTNELINTTITATSDKEKFEYDEDKNITVNVKDNNSEDISVNESDLSVFEGNNTIGFTYNNSIISIIDKLSVGNHTLTINFLGNSNYTSSQTTFLLKVLGNKTLEVPETVVVNGYDVTIPVKVFDGVEYIPLNEFEKFRLNLTYTEDGEIKTRLIDSFSVNDGEIQFNAGMKLINASILVNYTEAVEPKTVNIKIETNIAAQDAKINENDNKTVGVSVSDYDGDIVITQNDLKVLENGKELQFTYNNSEITIANLAVGQHNIKIVYQGNETYNASSKDIVIKVWGNQTINPQKIAEINGNKTVEIFLNLTDGVDPVPIDASRLNVTLFFKNGNVTTNRTIEASEIDINDQIISFKVEDTFDTAYADIKYGAENNLTGKTTLKVASAINADDFQKGETENKNFTITVTDAFGNILNITNKDIKVLNNGKEAKFTYNNSVVTLTDKYAAGVYNLTIKYIGNDTIAESAKDIVLTVYGINATSKVEVNSTKEGKINVTVINGNNTIDVNLNDLNITVTYKDGNDTKTIETIEKNYENGVLSFILENGNFTTATMTIRYNETETNVTINRIYNIRLEVINNINEYQAGNFTYKVIDVDTNTPITNTTMSMQYTMTGGSITLQNTIRGTTDENGIVNFKNSEMYSGYTFTYMNLTSNPNGGLEVGNHTVTISGSNMKIENAKQNLTIVKASINIVIVPYSEFYNSNKNLKINVTNAKTGEPVKLTIVHLYLKDLTTKDYYLTTNINGTAEIKVKGLVAGTYSMTVNNNDTKNINNKKVSGKFVIKKISVAIGAKDVTLQYNSATTTIKVTKNGKAVEGVILLIKLYTGKKYDGYVGQTNKKGEIVLPLPLAVGKHKMVITSEDPRYTAKQVTKTVTVKKAAATITAKSTKVYYKGNKYFTVKLTNSKTKKPIYYAKLVVNVFVSSTKYIKYTGTTGSNGELKIDLNSFKPGTYKVEVMGGDSKNFAAKKVTSKFVVQKAPTKLTPTKLTAKKGEKKYFQVKVTNSKTKTVTKGVKVTIKVRTGSTTKSYTVKTDSKGIAKICTNKLTVGTHSVSVTSADKNCVASKATSSIKITKK